MEWESRHLSVRIDRPAPAVYAYASDPTHLPKWAPGLCTSIERVDGRWVARMGADLVTIDFAPPNPYGVLDHDVTSPTGETVHNPMRVLPDGPDAAELVFTLRRRPGVPSEDFERDAAAVLADLHAIKRLLESIPSPRS